MSRIVVQEEAGQGKLLESSPFGYEEELKRHIIENPSLLQLDSVINEPVEHIAVGEEWYVGPGRVDIVLLGSDAVLTVVETKLKRNPEARRPVIAQVLEYAAYISEWTAGELQEAIEAFLHSEKCPRRLSGMNLDQALGLLISETDTSEDARDFLSRVEQNLRAGHIRLIVAVDEVGEEAQKIVTFVNSFSAFDVFLLQISEYQDGDKAILVPQLHGYARKVPSTPSRSRWTWERVAQIWEHELIVTAKALATRYETVLEDLQPEIRPYKNGFYAIVRDGWKLFGVEFSKEHGSELFFWIPRASARQDAVDTAGLEKRTTPSYVFLSGEFSSLSGESLRALCNESLDLWEKKGE